MLHSGTLMPALAASETYKAVSWGTRYMGMDRLKAEVSEYKLDAKVNVAVIDTGVNSSDTLFEGRINEKGSMNCCEGEDRSDYGDNMGHGSHVAGIIADATRTMSSSRSSNVSQAGEQPQCQRYSRESWLLLTAAQT